MVLLINRLRQVILFGKQGIFFELLLDIVLQAPACVSQEISAFLLIRNNSSSCLPYLLLIHTYVLVLRATITLSGVASSGFINCIHNDPNSVQHILLYDSPRKLLHTGYPLRIGARIATH